MHAPLSAVPSALAPALAAVLAVAPPAAAQASDATPAAPHAVREATGPRYVRVTEQAGLFGSHEAAPDVQTDWMTGALAVGDFDGSGAPDLFATSGVAGPDRLFLNRGDGTFDEDAAGWGLDAVHHGAGAAVGDVDADGRQDLYVTSGGPADGPVLPGANRLYRNVGGAFVEEAAAAGVQTCSPWSGLTFGAAFGDYDLDGDLDLFVATWESFMEGNRLFRNRGDGTFDDVTDAAFEPGALDPVHGFQACFVDTDGDHWPELLLAADFFTSRYFVNAGDGTFLDHTERSGTGLDSNGMGHAVADLDGDLALDWYVTSVHHDDGPPATNGNMLYRQVDLHTFEEVGGAAGAKDGGWGWGAAALDVDQDGAVDLVEVNGHDHGLPGEWSEELPRLFHNRGDGTFDELAAPAGLTHAASGRAVVWLDAEGDGDLDLAVCNNGAPLDLYRNDTPGGAWLQLVLDTSADPGLAPDGFGARVEALAGDVRVVRVVDGAPSYCGTSELVVHLGLGDAETVDVLRVRWSPTRSTLLHDVPVGQRLVVAAPPAR